jgi:hypothetical protein
MLIILALWRVKQEEVEFEASFRPCLKKEKKKKNSSWAPVAHTCNPTQEAAIRRIVVQSQPWTNSSPDPVWKKTHHTHTKGN